MGLLFSPEQNEISFFAKTFSHPARVAIINEYFLLWNFGKKIIAISKSRDYC